MIKLENECSMYSPEILTNKLVISSSQIDVVFQDQDYLLSQDLPFLLKVLFYYQGLFPNRRGRGTWYGTCERLLHDGLENDPAYPGCGRRSQVEGRCIWTFFYDYIILRSLMLSMAVERSVYESLLSTKHHVDKKKVGRGKIRFLYVLGTCSTNVLILRGDFPRLSYLGAKAP